MNRLILPQYIIYLEATEKATNLSNPNPSTPSSIEGRKNAWGIISGNPADPTSPVIGKGHLDHTQERI